MDFVLKNIDSIINENKKYKLNRPITGIIHKDRIWEQWYNPNNLKTELPKMNQRDYLFNCNKGFENQIILNNRGLRKITVSQFEKIVNLYSQSLKAYEIGEGDIICSVGLSTPELVALKYAAATVGAVTANLNFQDAVGDKVNNKMFKQLVKTNPRMIFYLDILENRISEILNLDEFRNTIKVCMPLCAFTPIFSIEKFKISLLKTSDFIRNLNVRDSISLSAFRKSGIQYGRPVQSIYHEKMPSNIAFTSATTGDSKAVVLSHDANNALALQHKLADLGLERGKKNLALVPPFLAFWDADIIHMAMCLGIENILELSLTYEEIPGYLLKHLPNYGIWSQFLWDSVLHMNPDDQKLISSHLDKAVVGGERAEINQQKRFFQIMQLFQVAGFGASEMDSCFSVGHPNCNVLGSAGLPLPFNNVRIKDSDFNDLTYNQPGRLLVTGPAMMNGYYKDQDLTNSVLIRDEEGTLWYDTKDYAYVDITGSIVPIDRDSNPVIINDTQIKLLDVAEKIKEYPDVKLCKLTSSLSKLVLHVTFDEFSENSKEEIIEGLSSFIAKNIPQIEQPHYIHVLDSLPRTPLGKVDYRKLDRITEDIVLEHNACSYGDSKLIVIDSTETDKIYEKRI